MSADAAELQRKLRQDADLDVASMLSFPASDPPAVFIEEVGAAATGSDDSRA